MTMLPGGGASSAWVSLLYLYNAYHTIADPVSQPVHNGVYHMIQ